MSMTGKPRLKFGQWQLWTFEIRNGVNSEVILLIEDCTVNIVVASYCDKDGFLEMHMTIEQS